MCSRLFLSALFEISFSLIPLYEQAKHAFTLEYGPSKNVTGTFSRLKTLNIHYPYVLSTTHKNSVFILFEEECWTKICMQDTGKPFKHMKTVLIFIWWQYSVSKCVTSDTGVWWQVNDGNLTTIRYQKEVLLPIELCPFFQRNRSMQLMQYGATAHTARTTIQLLHRQRVPVLPSRDLYPILNVWEGACLENLCRLAPTLWVLRDRIITEWNRIPQWFLHNILLSMWERSQGVFKQTEVTPDIDNFVNLSLYPFIICY